MHTTYSPLFSINISHAYFDGDNTPGILRMEPTLETKKLMKSIRVLIKDVNENKIVLYHSQNTRDQLDTTTENLKFVFELKVLTPDFISFTEFAIESIQDKIFLLNNQQPGPDYNGMILLHASEFVDENDFEKKETIDRRFVDGIVTIELDVQNLISTDGFKAADYAIRFKNRAVYYRYIIIGLSEKEATAAKIVSDIPTLSFSEPESRTLPNETNGFMFTSSEHIELKSKNTNQIKLNLKRAGQENSILLPHATPRNLKHDKKENKLYSDIYVYI